MNYPTYGELKNALLREHDMEGESFVQTEEMIDAANDGIDEAEIEINSLCEDYFKTKTTLALVSGQSDYNIPDDIYANKFREIYYENGTRRYKVTRLKDPRQGSKEKEANYQSPTDVRYQWTLDNPSADDGFKLVFVPTPQESGQFITIWYIRNANRVEDDNSLIDIPECVKYVKELMRGVILRKENANIMPPEQGVVIERERKKMLKALADRVPDNETEVALDLRHYEEHT